MPTNVLCRTPELQLLMLPRKASLPTLLDHLPFFLRIGPSLFAGVVGVPFKPAKLPSC